MARHRDFKKNPSTRFKDVGKLSKTEAREEARALREALDYHNYLYYVKNQPAISDAIYDKLFRRLEELEEAFADLRSETSPTRRVGAEPVDDLAKVEHTAPMLSLHAVVEEDEVAGFLRTVANESRDKQPPLIAEPKFDGVSVEVVYRDGQFSYGATRGDGQTGEDVSENLKTIGAVLMRLRGRRHPRLLAVRGEVFITKEAFQKMNRERVERDEPTFANPRNATAGILRRLSSREVARWPLDIYFYDVLAIEGRKLDTHHDELAQFDRWGLKTTDQVRRCDDLAAVRKFRERMAERRGRMAYEIDGIVLKVDELALRRRLGTRHRSPRWALAWKFPPRHEVTTLEDIVVQVGRTGILTPVALLGPVDVGGVTISRATLHNEQEVHRKDVRVGDRVRIARAGDVIPEVVRRVPQRGRKRGKPFSMPRKCPACGARLVKENAYTICPAGLACPPQLIGRVLHYGSREALDIDGLGEKTVEQLVRSGKVSDLADLYHLSVEDLQQLEGFARPSAEKLRKAIEKTRRPRLHRFLYALGIRHVGRRLARLLAETYGSLDAVRSAEEQQLRETAQIGPEIAHSVARFFRQAAHRKVLRRIARAGVEVQPVAGRRAAGPLKGKTIVFTGRLEHYGRAEAKELAERLGGRATSSVSDNTDYVVAGQQPGSKLDEARRRGVKVLSERQFQRLASR